MAESGAPVELYVYDLSHGLARQLSPQLVGRLVEGIWHTSVVVYGTEWYYGQGVLRAKPGSTAHGAPLQRLAMGHTKVSVEELVSFVTRLAEAKYTADRYRLLDHNCNHFSAEVVQYLTGGEIPAYIRDLPREILATDFGRALQPLLEGAQPPSRLPSDRLTHVHSPVEPALATSSLEAAVLPDPHPHRRLIPTPALNGLGHLPILFPQPEGARRALARLRALPEAQRLDPVVLADDQLDYVAPLSDPTSWRAALDHLYDTLKPTDRFPVLDLVRYALTCPGLCGAAEGETGFRWTKKLLSDATAVATDSEAVPRPLLITALRLACNIWACDNLVDHLSQPPTVEGAGTPPLLDVLTGLMVHAILCSEVTVRQAGAALAFNLGAWVGTGRRAAYERARGATRLSDTSPLPSEWCDHRHEDWLIEAVSAITEALRKEPASPTAFRLLAALAHLLYLAPAGTLELADVLGLGEWLADHQTEWPSEPRGAALACEVVALLAARPT
ncbi:hypothetical protein IWQ60_002487 [Tieghemiomyces parasiticus]|uniref:PPPDE domain-containing protein n=1 Tax=Tieghemiomyces parasiticus TaxID=78921 RepID=A0A9W8E0X4_9FUNG|nr:hypothetical protein IWQ60_002487 [Tieghemiomyces parasiticus]